MNTELILRNQISIMEVLKSQTNIEWYLQDLQNQINETQLEINSCQHPFKEAVSGDEEKTD
jgi:peptidoglycan hydrolase CwlO-like protein